MTDNEFAHLAVGFVSGSAYAFSLVALAVWVINKVDEWWGHRQYRNLEAQNAEPSKVDAVSDADMGFRP